MRLKIVLIHLSLGATIAHASLYRCDSPNGSPIPILDQGISKEINYETKAPVLLKDAKNKKYHNRNRTPFLIYYAIDSSEPFMKHSVLFEIANLAKACTNSEHVNFVAIINSAYVEKNEIILCKNKKLQKTSLDQYPIENRVLKEKRELIRTGDHTGNNKGHLKYLVKYDQTVNEAFYNFPLSHPDFLYEFLNLVISNESLFPYKSYMPFLNLKSHGSNDTVLSGLYNCQINSKTQTQLDVIEATLTKEESNFLLSLDSVDKAISSLEKYESILEKLHLGNSAGAGTSMLNGDYNLGSSSSLGQSINSNTLEIGSTLFGLGAHDGLGSQSAFGLHHVTLNAVIDEVFKEKENKKLGFLMLESCDTKREATFDLTYMKNILGFYSAKSSLWYRNLNWWDIMLRSKRSTKDMLQNIETEAARIPNLSLTDKT